MLQQTRVARVIPAYRRFLRRFPTARALARARLGDVLVEWSGLGYPRRARDLHRAARASLGRLPADPAGLDALPGIGAYTAGAVACFSTGAPVPFADTNIRRVLGRALRGGTVSEREAVVIDATTMPRSDASGWHHALMDLGATVCLARAPRCGECPVYDLCLAKGADATPSVRRQAAFATSDRRVRGAIMRAVAERRSVPLARLRELVADDRVDRLVNDLRADGRVAVAHGRVRLPWSASSRAVVASTSSRTIAWTEATGRVYFSRIAALTRAISASSRMTVAFTGIRRSPTWIAPRPERESSRHQRPRGPRTDRT